MADTASRSSIKSEIGKSFSEKWGNLISDGDACFNLLTSAAENDFSGMLEVVDYGYVGEFLVDLIQMLRKLGKISDVKQVKLAELIDDADPSKSIFESTKDGNLPARTLTIIRDVTGYKRGSWNNYGQRCSEFVFERLASIVDDRYILVIGTAAELSSFLDEDRRLAYTFGQHRMKMSVMDVGPVYKHYLHCLDSALAAQADDAFSEQFADFVHTNADDLPFHGRELADYLAKHANARKELVLPKSRHESASTHEQLENLIGLDHVKADVEELKCLALAYKRDLKSGVEVPRTRFHMLLVGNPGVGKTTAARIIGRMLFEIGVIPTDKFVEVTAKDLISEYIGGSARDAGRVIERARGGVLFIDEAYSLIVNPDSKSGSSYGREALAELVKAMDQYDDIIVMLAGYRDEMRELIAVNPGLKSRIAYTLEFDDYTPDQLTQMFVQKASQSGLKVGAATKDSLAKLFAFHSKLEHFGNGRFVDQVFQRAYAKRAIRIQKKASRSRDSLTASDIPTTSEMLGEHATIDHAAKTALEDIVGLDSVKTQILDLERSVAFREEARKRGMKLPDQSLHMVFSGNPGTGKTTIARLIGDLLFSMGAIPSTKFVEVTARDLVSTYAGGTALKTVDVIDKASGGVLFVDEAYALTIESGTGGLRHGEEALAELVKAMEDRKDRLVVIFAGYSDEMRGFLDTNPGMRSRIGYHFVFPDYSVEELTEMLLNHLAAAGFSMDESAIEAARKVLAYFSDVKDFGNGRFVYRLMQETIIEHSKNCTQETFCVISGEDIPSVERMASISATDLIPPQGMVDDETRRRVSYHEIGHALCRIALRGSTDVVEIVVSKEDKGGSLGRVLHRSTRRSAPSDKAILSAITSAMGGMAAETCIYGFFTGTNAKDLKKATTDAVRYVATFGMSDLGFVQFADSSDEVDLRALPTHVQDKVKEILDSAYTEACSIIENNRGFLDAAANELVGCESITGERLMELWGESNAAPLLANGDLCPA